MSEQNAVHLASPDTYIKYTIQTDVRPSVAPFSQCYCHRIIMKVIANDRSDVRAKGHGQRSKVMVTEVKTRFSHFRIVTPV